MVLDAVLFGIIQGIFEWLPISSQGNLVLLMVSLFGYSAGDAISYSIFLHTGTMLAAIVYFRKDVLSILRSLPGYRLNYKERNGVISFLIIATIITGLVGYPIYMYLKATPFIGEVFIGLVGIALIFTGMIQRTVKGSGKRNLKNLNLKDTILLGITQGLSIIPGISRSGITVSSLLFRNYNSSSALKLSFLMSIPAIFVAEIGLGMINGLPSLGIDKIIAGLVFSFVLGMLTIHALIRIAGKFSFWKFCIIMGIIALLPLLFYA
ncbi:MAG: undecaprenyl-diphosphate phosphatase [Candidatus Aenigmarchaeota archaeon]|nr:undecaprenyl-diphosphate phosphatase [Candidatus Aenigmarchaeota archaeon]